MMIRLLDGPKWIDWKNQIEQSGYEVRHHERVFAVLRGGEPYVAIIPQLNNRLVVWADDLEDPEHYNGPEQAMAALLRKLSINYPYWMGGGGVFLTRSQLKAFSSEWQELFQDLATDGCRVTLEQGRIWFRFAGMGWIFAAHHRGEWRVFLGGWSERFGDNEGAIEHIRSIWSDIAAYKEGATA